MKEQGNFEARNEALTHPLKQLWKGVVEPISDALRLERIDGPPTIKACMLNSLGKHVTWICTGSFQRLLVHMAFDTFSGYATPLGSHVVSSSASSFRVLTTDQLWKSVIRKSKNKTSSFQCLQLQSPLRPRTRSVRGHHCHHRRHEFATHTRRLRW